MAEVQPTSAPMSVFQQAHEEQQYNLFLLEQHQLAEGLIYGERPSEKVVATMAAANPNFVVEQCVIYDTVRAQAANRQEEATAEVQLQEIAEENHISCASYAPPANNLVARWDDDNAGGAISILDLTSTGDGQGADSSEDE